MLFIVETEKQQYFKEVLDRLEIDLYTDLSYCKERQSIPFHCRYKELIIFIIAYFLLYCPAYSILHIFFWDQPLAIISWNRCSLKLSKIL